MRERWRWMGERDDESELRRGEVCVFCDGVALFFFCCGDEAERRCLMRY